jgi:hypothetical protein
MLLNQQQTVVSDSSAFALFTQRTSAKHHHFNLKGKMPQEYKYPPRGQNSPQMDSLATNLELGCHPTSIMIGGPTPTLVKALTMLLEIPISNLKLYPISTNLLELPAKFVEKQVTMH